MVKRINPTLDEGVSGDQWEEFLADVRGHVRSHPDWKRLAEEASLSPQTISRLAYGDTASPHMRTVLQIMVAIGRRSHMVRAFKSKQPVSKSEAQAARPPKGVRRKTWLERQKEKQEGPWRKRR